MNVTLPVELTDQHVLALPQGTDLLALARAWFADAAWEREPATATPVARPMTGARFRGIVVQDAPSAVPGRLAVGGAVLVGPRPLTSDEVRATGLRAGEALDLYGVEGPASPQLSAWCTAAARHAGGLLVPASRTDVVVPDPQGAPGLTLWSPVPLAPRDVLPLVRPAMVGARVSPTEVPTPVGGGPQECAVTAVFDYDGTVTLRSARSDDVPAVLATLDWREYGPWAYHVRWRPADGEDPDSSLSAIARQRVAPTIARVTAALWRAAGGTVVDEGGFVVRSDEVTRRAVPPR